MRGIRAPLLRPLATPTPGPQRRPSPGTGAIQHPESLALTAGTLAFLGAHAAEPEQVTLSLPEFLQLSEKSRERKPAPEQAPRACSLASANDAGEVIVEDAEPLSGLFTTHMQVQDHQEKGGIKVSVLTCTVALASATVNGRRRADRSSDASTVSVAGPPARAPHLGPQDPDLAARRARHAIDDENPPQ